jgi:hypothetical protein
MRPLHVAAGALCLLSVLLFLEGCPSKPPPGVRFPITNGSHTILPTTDQHILIWADPPLSDVAAEWLRTHHYSHLLMPDKAPLQAPQIAHDFSTRTAALAVAQEMKAEVVLVLEREATKDGALIEPYCGALYHVSVELQGVSVESGNTAFRGRAHYPHCVDLSDKTTRSLTCQVFATAWGFRPSGQLEIPSSLMCTTGQTVPTSVDPKSRERETPPGQLQN